LSQQAQLAAAAQQFSGDSTTLSSSISSPNGGNEGAVGGALDGNGARGILPSWMKNVLGQATKQAGSAEMALGERRVRSDCSIVHSSCHLITFVTSHHITSHPSHVFLFVYLFFL